MATMAQDSERTYRSEEREYRWHGHTGRGRLRDESADRSERQFAMFNHLAGLLSLADFTFLGVIATVVMWLSRRDDSEFLDDHGKEAVNFQISLLLYVVFGVVAAVLFAIMTLGIGAPLLVIFGPLGAVFLFVLRLVGCISAAMAANRGEFYRYPMCIRLIR